MEEKNNFKNKTYDESEHYKKIDIFENILKDLEELKYKQLELDENIKYATGYHKEFYGNNNYYKDIKERIENRYKDNFMEKFYNRIFDIIGRTNPLLGVVSKIGVGIFGSMAAAGKGVPFLSNIAMLNPYIPLINGIFSALYLIQQSAMFKQSIKEREMYSKGLEEPRFGALGHAAIRTSQFLDRIEKLTLSIYTLPAMFNVLGMHSLTPFISPLTMLFNPTNILGGLMLSAPVLGGALSGIASSLSWIPLITPALIGYLAYMGLFKIPIGFLKQIVSAGDRKPNFLNAYEIENETSSSRYLRPYVIRILSDPDLVKQVSPYDMLILETLMMIESHTSIIPLIYNLLQNKIEAQKFESYDAGERRVQETLYEGYRFEQRSFIDKMMDKMEEFMFLTNPVMQLTEFLFRGITPAQWLRNRYIEERRANVINELSRKYGVSMEHIKAVYTTSDELIGGIDDPIVKMVVLLSAIYDVLRMQLSELTAIRNAMGIAQSFMIQLPEEEQGMNLFDRLTTMLIDIPNKLGNVGAALVSNISTKVLEEGLIKGTVKGISEVAKSEIYYELKQLPIIYTWAILGEKLVSLTDLIVKTIKKDNQNIQTVEQELSLLDRLLLKIEDWQMNYEERKYQRQLMAETDIEEFFVNRSPEFISTQTIINEEIMNILKQIDNSVLMNYEIVASYMAYLEYLVYLRKIHELLEEFINRKDLPTITPPQVLTSSEKALLFLTNINSVVPSTIFAAPEPEYIVAAPEAEEINIGKMIVGQDYLISNIQRNLNQAIEQVERQENIYLPQTVINEIINSVPIAVGNTVYTVFSSLRHGAPHFSTGGIVEENTFNKTTSLKASKSDIYKYKDTVVAMLSPGEIVLNKDQIKNVSELIINTISLVKVADEYLKKEFILDKNEKIILEKIGSLIIHDLKKIKSLKSVKEEDSVITVKEREEKILREKFYSNIEKMVKLLGEISKGVYSLDTHIVGGFNILKKSFTDTVKFMTDRLTSAISTISGTGSSIWDWLSGLLGFGGGDGKNVSKKEIAKGIFSKTTQIIKNSFVGGFGVGSLLNAVLTFFTFDENTDMLHKILGTIGALVGGGVGAVVGGAFGGLPGLILSMILSPIGASLGLKLADFIENVYSHIFGSKDENKIHKEIQAQSSSVAEALGETVSSYLTKAFMFIISLPITIINGVLEFIKNLFVAESEKHKKEIEGEQDNLIFTIIGYAIDVIKWIFKFIFWDLPRAVITAIADFIYGLGKGIVEGFIDGLNMLLDRLINAPFLIYDIGKPILSKIWSIVKSVGKFIWDIIKEIGNVILKIINFINPLNILEILWGALTETIKELKESDNVILRFIGNILTPLEKIGDFIVQFVEKIKEIFSRILEPIISAVKWFKEILSDIVNKITEYIHKVVVEIEYKFVKFVTSIPFVGKKIAKEFMRRNPELMTIVNLKKTGEELKENVKYNSVIQSAISHAEVTRNNAIKQYVENINNYIEGYLTLIRTAALKKEYSELRNINFEKLINEIAIISASIINRRIKEISDKNITNIPDNLVKSDAITILLLSLKGAGYGGYIKEIKQLIQKQESDISKSISAALGKEIHAKSITQKYVKLEKYLKQGNNKNLVPNILSNEITDETAPEYKEEVMRSPVQNSNTVNDEKLEERYIQSVKAKFSTYTTVVSEKISSSIEKNVKELNKSFNNVVDKMRESVKETATEITKNTTAAISAISNTVTAAVVNDKSDLMFDRLIEKVMNHSVIDISDYSEKYYVD